MAGYRSQTLRSDNLQRLSFLPSFPLPISSTTIDDRDQQREALLLSSVPDSMLSTAQLQRRETGTFASAFEYVEKKDHPVASFMKFIYHNLILNGSRQWQVDASIIDFNLTRLDEITIQSVLHRAAQYDPDDAHGHLNPTYPIYEWPLALEIFLQIDVDTLFMKTCSFRGAHPRRWKHGADVSSTEGLFCHDPPEARYLMLPCTNSSCFCCYPSLAVSHRVEPSVPFAAEQAHRFVNGYQVYLNCHATCKTTHFIYALTCPCGQFDFVGSSVDPHASFKEVFLHHRRQSLRVLHEFLLGEKIIKRTLDMYEREKTIEEKKADRQRLYQHLTECAAAMQLLLNGCAYYWSFVPMRTAEADQEDLVFKMARSGNDEGAPEEEDRSQDWSPCERTDPEVEWCLANLPKTPDGTRFSRLQRSKQRLFFKKGWDLLFLPPRHLDIFTMSLIFVLPDDCSHLLCHVIESLLITHAECRLNTNHHLIIHPRQLSEERERSNNHRWFEHLVGRTYKS